MDQGPLVTEQIEAGERLVGEFAKFQPLQAAFWVKEGEDGSWLLYLASDQIDDSNFDLAYAEVLRLCRPGSDLWLDPFQVRVAGIDDAVVKDVLALQQTLQQKYPGRLPTRLSSRMLGDMYIEDALIYPVPLAARP